MLRLDLVAGPNGAGKSTFIEFILRPVIPRSVFVNADEIAKSRWPDDAEAHGYEASRIAAETRAKLIEARMPFIAETVFSHPSKLDLITDAQANGYTVILNVILVPEEVSVSRVLRRVAAGGHSVPEQKIRQRHRRLWALVTRAIELADKATAWDNTEHEGPRKVGQWVNGLPVDVIDWPTWAAPELTERWPSTNLDATDDDPNSWALATPEPPIRIDAGRRCGFPTRSGAPCRNSLNCPVHRAR